MGGWQLGDICSQYGVRPGEPQEPELFVVVFVFRVTSSRSCFLQRSTSTANFANPLH
jgi:hypothetical protein